MAQIYTDAGVALQTSDVGSVTVRVYDRAYGATSSPASAVYELENFATTGVIINTFQTSGWDVDGTGYNFAYNITSESFTRNGGHVYRLEFTLNSSTWGPIYVIHDCRVRSTLDN